MAQAVRVAQPLQRMAPMAAQQVSALIPQLAVVAAGEITQQGTMVLLGGEVVTLPLQAQVLAEEAVVQEVLLVSHYS